ncbi:MAG: carbohydrate-binding family 9-like protein [Planctomycetia bacterium]|jgi:hypothetical protein
MKETSSETKDSSKARPSYRVAKTDDFEVTGSGDKPAWAKAPWCSLKPFRDGGPDYEARFKVLYSDRGLYVLMDGTDRKLSATKTDDFDNLWTEDVFEFFLWPDQQRTIYFEYEISPLEKELVLLVPNMGGHRKQHGWRPWHYEGDRRVKKKVTVHGGKMAPGEKITGWTAEVFVPYELLKPLENVPPRSGTQWRANVYRCDYDDAKSAGWYWSRTKGSFHDYNRFGTLIFE